MAVKSLHCNPVKPQRAQFQALVTFSTDPIIRAVPLEFGVLARSLVNAITLARNCALLTFLLLLSPPSTPAQPLRGDSAFPLSLPNLRDPESNGVQWGPLLRQSLFFVSIQHAFRVTTEKDTQDGLGGPFFSGWARSAANLHGWADGDPFFVNYVGHPIEGAVAGFIFVQNDPKYQRVEFGHNRDYWRSRLRAAGWAWAYSTQFEIGPISEASIGKVQSHFPQQGFVDHVITPSIGLTWMLAEDAMDRYLIRRIEAQTENKTIRIFARGLLNPSRSMANVLRGNYPWHRDTRAGVALYRAPLSDRAAKNILDADRSLPDEYQNDRRYAPFELSVQYGFSQLGVGRNGAQSCNGGSATALFNLNANLGLEAEVGGCKLDSPEPNITGDATLYLFGPRYTFRDLGRWEPYLHLLGGGEKLTTETFDPARKAALSGHTENLTPHQLHSLYTTSTQVNSLAVQMGAGVDYKLNRALAFKIANIEYLHNYAPEFNGMNPRNNVRFTTGIVLRMGTW